MWRRIVGIGRTTPYTKGMKSHWRNRIVTGLLTAAAIAAGACDKTTPPPPAGTGGAGGAGTSNPINKLAENPNSLLGKSAATARDAARKASSAQDAAVGAAQEMSGEASALDLAGLTWSAPAAWEKVKPASTMRAAEFKVDGAGGAASVVFFINIGGDAASNIERWRTQFISDTGGSPQADIASRTIAGCKVSLVKIQGTFKGGQPGGPAADSADWGLRGAVVEGGPKGPVFIKFTGPEATLAEHDAAWNTMINGMRKP